MYIIVRYTLPTYLYMSYAEAYVKIMFLRTFYNTTLKPQVNKL